MPAFFAGSGVVIIEGPGHGYERAPSKCAFDLVVKYMKDGIFPENEVTCQMDVKADYFCGCPSPDRLDAKGT
ncbi:hypothetical protein C7974DRAFT_405354 [Boeremia exigua]|uniref:uncharacterized protein n=1 Tax=Boeremia exigua TaxID=749465 RepID=UPI001E8D3098|nr:uncharacterized protein C7974DRAFT_405354 [Boeremia exigua]KAH6613197.1 hypothetical protein C7974DRAFT_405354 [Boeremia exigua]